MNLVMMIEKVNELSYISNEYIIEKNSALKKLDELSKKLSIQIDNEIAEFICYVNGKMFYDWVQYKGHENVPVLDGKVGDIGLFYSLKEGMQYELFDAMVSNNDIFNDKDLLIAEATPGDFLVISFEKKEYGQVYFISHDFNEDEKYRFLVAENVKDFISSMFVKKE